MSNWKNSNNMLNKSKLILNAAHSFLRVFTKQKLVRDTYEVPCKKLDSCAVVTIRFVLSVKY